MDKNSFLVSYTGLYRYARKSGFSNYLHMGTSYVETKNRDLWKVYGLSETWSFHDTDVEGSGLLSSYVGWQGY